MCEKCAVFEKYKTFHVECIPREIFLMYVVLLHMTFMVTFTIIYFENLSFSSVSLLVTISMNKTCFKLKILLSSLLLSKVDRYVIAFLSYDHLYY